MRSGLILGLAAALVTLTAVPAHAEPRFEPLDPSRLGEVVQRPAAVRPDRMVNALVELRGEPVAAQLRPDAKSADRRRAARQVKNTQDAALPRLRAAGATAYGRLDTVLNAVQVRVRQADLRAVAAVLGVKRVQVSRAVHLDNSASSRFTGADRARQDYGLSGRGQQIAIIDSGIDYTHAAFGGPGTVAAFADNDGTVIEADTFPTAKVTAGYDFVGNDFDPDSTDPTHQVVQPDPDPLDCNGHGSHVAGIAADVAPQATLAAYRAFSCNGASDDGALIAALDQAVSDGADVVNLSLGTAFGSPDNLLGVAIKAATAAGVLVVAAGGNAGPGSYLTDSPGTLNEVLSVAAVDAELAHYPGVAITGAAVGAGINANEVELAAPVSGVLVDAGLGCQPGDYAAAAGQIALTVRGQCDRAVRAQLGQQAGVRAVVMINSDPGLPPLEGPIDGATIPFVGVAGDDAAELTGAVGEVITLTRGADLPNADYGRVAPLSSSGPRRLDSAQKPDLAAPGMDVLSVRMGSGTGEMRRSGTSMASPQVAGIAALVRQAHPAWSATQIKAVIMSTGSPGRIAGYDSRRLGTGLVQPRRAVAAQTYAWTPSQLNSLRFGHNQLSGAYAERHTFKITNRSRRSATYDLRSRLSSERYGTEVQISPRTVTIKPGRTRTVAVTLRLSRSDVARLPGASASDGGALVSIHGRIEAVPRGSRSGVLPLRMTFLFVPVPLSDVRSSLVVRATAPGVNPPIRVRNAGVHSGTAELFTWLLADPGGDAGDREVADLTDLGVQARPGESVGASPEDRLLVFAAAEALATSTHATREVDVAIDATGDGKIDFYTFAADVGLTLDGAPNGRLGAFTIDATGQLVDAWDATAPANGSTVLMPVLASSLGVTAATGPLTVTASGLTVFPGIDAVDQIDDSASFDPYAPALSQGGQTQLAPGQSATIPVQVDDAQLAEQTARGWLVVTQDDRSGRHEANRVRLISPAAVRTR